MAWAPGKPLPLTDITSALDHKAVPHKEGTGRGRRVVPGKQVITHYLVRWSGTTEDEWEPVGVLDPTHKLIVAYRLEHGLDGQAYV